MDEIKGRLTCIHYALSGKMDALPKPVLREFLFLQIRFICEVIALSCLCAHGDMEETGKLKGDWKPKNIMDGLQELNPTFYPRPMVSQRMDDGSVHFDDVKDPFLSKHELIKLHGQCGDVLHKGSFKSLSKPKDFVEDFVDIKEYNIKIVKLLNEHLITLYDGQWQFICQMGGVNEKVNVGIATVPKTDV